MKIAEVIAEAPAKVLPPKVVALKQRRQALQAKQPAQQPATQQPPVPSSTGGTIQKTATGIKHTSSPTNPNAPTQPAPAAQQPATPASAQPPAQATTTSIPVGTELKGPDGLIYQFQGKQWVQKPGQPGGKGLVASREVSANLMSQVAASSQGSLKNRIKKGAEKIGQAAVGAADKFSRSFAGQTLAGIGQGISQALRQVGKGAGDPAGLGGYQDYTK